jgi:ferritin
MVKMRPQLISDATKTALVEQIGAEKFNASIYLYLASFLNGKGLSKLAKFFENQHNEEQEHSLIIYKLLVDLGETFEIPEINACNMPINTIGDIANLFLQREIETTNSLKAIKELATEQGEGGCSVVEVAMIDMIKKQQSELDEATSFYDKSELFPEWWQVGLWNETLED